MPAKCCSRHYPISFTLSPTPISLLLPMCLKDILVVSKNIIDDIEDYLLSIGKAIFCGIFTSYPNKIATQNEYYTQEHGLFTLNKIANLFQIITFAPWREIFFSPL